MSFTPNYAFSVMNGEKATKLRAVFNVEGFVPYERLSKPEPQ